MDVEALRADPAVAHHEAVVPLDPDAFERVRATVERGDDVWVAAVVTDDDDRVLLVRNAWSDGWVPPGGDVEQGETLRAAATREVREETGVAAAVGDPVAVVDETFTCGGREVVGHRVVFAARAATTGLSGDPGLDGEGIAAVRWFDALPEQLEGREVVAAALDRLD